jgi:hypothetical protein
MLKNRYHTARSHIAEDDKQCSSSCTLRAVCFFYVQNVVWILFSVLNPSGICYATPVACEGKGLPQQAEVAQGVPGWLRPRIFLTFGITRVVDRQPYAPAAFTPAEISGTHFLEAESTPGHMVLSVATEKIPSDTIGIDPETVRLVAQCLNHYQQLSTFR